MFSQSPATVSILNFYNNKNTSVIAVIPLQEYNTYYYYEKIPLLLLLSLFCYRNIIYVIIFNIKNTVITVILLQIQIYFIADTYSCQLISIKYVTTTLYIIIEIQYNSNNGNNSIYCLYSITVITAITVFLIYISVTAITAFITLYYFDN